MGTEHYVAVDDVWVQQYAFVSGIKWSGRWGQGPSGPDVASFTVDVEPSYDSSWLRLKADCEVWQSGVKVFGGRISEMGRGFPREVHVKSWARHAADFDALDASGNPTTNPRTAVTQAIARGLPWSTGTMFDNTSFGDDTVPTANRLDALLNAWAAATGKVWGVDAEQVPFASVAPTTATWWLNAENLDIGVADDGLFTRVNAPYVSAVDAATPPNPTAWDSVTSDDLPGQALYGVIEYPMDLTALGLLSSATAQSYADQQKALLTVPQWLSRVAVNSQTLITEGGLPAHLPSVREGQVVRLFNVPNNLGGLRNELALDVTLGEVEHDAENPDEITIAPVGLAVRDLLGALTAAKKAADDAAAAKAALVA